MKYYSSGIAKLTSDIKAEHLSALLLYGPNMGLIDFIVSSIVSVLACELRRFDDEPVGLRSILNAKSFFVKKEVICIKIKTAFSQKDALSTVNVHFPIIISDELPPANAMRKWFESGKSVAVVPCYMDDENTRRKLIKDFIERDGKSIDYDAIEYLVSSLEVDRRIILSELEKVSLYCDAASQDQDGNAINNKVKISYNDCVAAINGSIDGVSDVMCAAHATKNVVLFEEQIMKLSASGISAVWILRALARYYNNLFIVKMLLKGGVSLEESMSKIKPPIFFKYVPMFKKSIAAMSLKDISTMLGIIWEYEILIKTTADDDSIIAALILNISE
jgi:DNA polymerase-3 subunit delta